MKIIKKNQLTILVLALMLVTAGYLNYNNNLQGSKEIASIGDATLVSSDLSDNISDDTIISNTKENNSNEIDNTDNNSIENLELNTKTENTNAEISNTEEYFTSSRLERDTMYSQMLEAYQKILDSKTTNDKQKDAAQKEVDNIGKIKNSIMISENLIKTKGFNDVIIFVNDESISVVVKKEELEKEDIAQIQSIIAREMNAKIDNIHIMNK